MEAKNYSVYVHRFPNGKVYVGITGKKPEQRWKRGRNYGSNPAMMRAIAKYGWDNIEHAVLFSGITQKEAEEKERELISLYHANDGVHGYNITNGGESVGKMTEETKRKISEIKKAQYSTPEFRKKLSEGHKGLPAHNKGVPMTEEQRRKVSLAKMGCEGTGKRKVICIDSGTVYESITEASRETGAQMSKIIEVCKHHRKATLGQRWEYVEE